MSSVLSFVWRHKRKFLFSGLVIGGVCIAARECLNYVSRMQESKAQELIEASKKQQYFETTERTCNQTLISLIPSFYDSVDKLLDTKRLINSLKLRPPNKIALWEELKELVFARVCLINYAASIINVILRVQINVIGGCLYKNATNDDDVSFSASMQEEYLSLCRYFLSDGMEELSDMILRKVRKIVCRIPLDEKLDFDELQRLLWTLQAAIEVDQYDPVIFMERYVRKLGSTFKGPLTAKQKEIFEEIVNETVDIISSDDVCSLASSLVWAGFQYTCDRLKECYMSTIHDSFKISSNASAHENICSKSGDVSFLSFKPVAKLIPILNGLVQSPSSSDPNGCFMHLLVQDANLKILGANIYEAFCQ